MLLPLHKSSINLTLILPLLHPRRLHRAVFCFPLTCTLRCSVRGNKIMQQPIYKGLLPLHWLHLQTASVSTQSAWGSSGAITKTSHNSFFCVCSSEAVAVMMMAMMIIIIQIFKACLLVPLSACQASLTRRIRSHGASFEGIAPLVSLLPRRYPNPCEPLSRLVRGSC